MDGKGSTSDPYFGGFVNTLYERFDPYSISSLQILIVRSCKLFSNSVLLQIVKHCKNLRTLGKTLRATKKQYHEIILNNVIKIYRTLSYAILECLNTADNITGES